MKTFVTAIATLLVGAGLAVPLAAQVDVVVEGTQDPSTTGETVVLDSEAIGQRVSQRLYLGFDPGPGESITLRSIRIRGSSDFTYEIVDVNRLPVVIRNELQLELFLSYLPTGPGPAQATLEMTVRLEDSEFAPTDTVNTVNLVGRVPSFSVSYMLPRGSSRAVPPAGVLDFGNKPTDQPTEATVIISNNGSLSGTLQGVSLSGTSVYELVNPPSFPSRLDPGRSLNLQLAFTPRNTDAYRGILTLDFGSTEREVNLLGTGGDLFQYRIRSLSPDGIVVSDIEVQSGSTIRFGDQAASLEIVGRNIRQGAALLPSLNVTGAFEITDGPTVPASIGPQESFTITVEPRAVMVGELTGTVAVGDAYFDLELTVPELPTVQFSRSGGTVAASEEVPLALSLAAPFPVDLSGSLTLEFVPKDFEGDPSLQWATGGREVAFTIAAGSTGAVFGPDGQSVSFKPGPVDGEVVVTARIGVESWAIDLTPETVPEVRFDVSVPELPEVRFSRSGGTLRGTDVVPVGLSIAGPFPVDLSGTLSLEFLATDFEADPTLQWATGGRQVSFTIMAGTTSATFGAEDAEVEFRAARVPGEIVVTAHLRAPEWNMEYTADDLPELRFDVTIPELPKVSFSSAGGTVDAADQVSLGLSIAQAYSTDIVGLLQIAFETQVFASDPAVQWSSGGRAVPFSILQGSTQAIFVNDASTVSFQTGTVAGEIVVSALFVSVVDGVPRSIEEARAQTTALDITPDARPEVRFNVMEAAPVIQRAALGATGQGRFTLMVTGYATSRTVDTLAFEFTGIAGSDLRTPSLSADVTENFRTYFGGNQSISVGSQFTATVEFTIDEGVYEDLSNVAVTATNSSGTSNSVTVELN